MTEGALHVVLPGSIDTPTGGYRYDRRMVNGLRACGREVRTLELDGSFPRPTPAALAGADAALGDVPDGTTTVVDGLAFGAMPELAARHAGRLDLVALVHHPLMLETGLSPADAARHRDEEGRALAHVRRVVVTSATTATGLDALDVDPARVRVVPPGTDAAPISTGSADGVPALLCVATIVPRKDHATLVEALARVRHRPWRLTCVGSPELDPPTVRALRARIAALGLEDRIELAGALDEADLDAHRAASDVFVLASVHEGYGMALIEAVASGLPIVATRGGAIADTVPHGAALLVDPGDVEAFADALEAVLGDGDLRARLRSAALVARGRLRGWDAAVAEFALAIARDPSGHASGAARSVASDAARDETSSTASGTRSHRTGTAAP